MAAGCAREPATSLSDDGDKLQRAVRRAAEAKRVLDEPLLVEAFEQIEKAANAAIRDQVVKLTDAQLRAIATVPHVVAQVRKMLGKVMADGEAAKAEIRNLMVKDAMKSRKKAA